MDKINPTGWGAGILFVVLFSKKNQPGFPCKDGVVGENLVSLR